MSAEEPCSGRFSFQAFPLECRAAATVWGPGSNTGDNKGSKKKRKAGISVEDKEMTKVGACDVVSAESELGAKDAETERDKGSEGEKRSQKERESCHELMITIYIAILALEITQHSRRIKQSFHCDFTKCKTGDGRHTPCLFFLRITKLENNVLHRISPECMTAHRASLKRLRATTENKGLPKCCCCDTSRAGYWEQFHHISVKKKTL